ncbi:(2Fe-2S)-binding protein [Kiloniella sp. b19]|uniref:(2Fe-2S)-binding protein n=1 Tax=Kiloniella sp. GXU_MW_B19 TaxID=3141326 RepID=UPI0031D36866
MYVCICNAFNQRDVRTAYDNGARTVGSVYKAMNCKPQCGKCKCDIRSVLEKSALEEVDFKLAAE